MTIGYYVTVIRDNRVGWLFGPIADRDAARAFVEPVRRLACNIDPWCAFDLFGTSSIKRAGDQPLPPGKLNDHWSYFQRDHY